MPWDMDDYPSSFKNFDQTLRKKAIDIANSMIQQGYTDNQAIPIATKQAKEWYKHASDEELEEYKKHGDPTSSSKKHSNNPELLDQPEYVIPHEDGWAVKAKGANRAAKVFNTKNEAVKYGRKVAKNKGTKLKLFKRNEEVQETRKY